MIHRHSCFYRDEAAGGGTLPHYLDPYGHSFAQAEETSA